MRVKQISTILLIALSIKLAVGCATIVHGTSQNVEIASAPDNAEIWIDGARVGMTPTRLTLKRGDSHLIVVKKEGYKESTVKLEKNVSAWIIGNVVFGGLIGCAIDLVSGGAYDLKPGRVDINLTQLAHDPDGVLEVPVASMEEIEEVRFFDGPGTEPIVVAVQWAE